MGGRQSQIERIARGMRDGGRTVMKKRGEIEENLNNHNIQSVTVRNKLHVLLEVKVHILKNQVELRDGLADQKHSLHPVRFTGRRTL